MQGEFMHEVRSLQHTLEAHYLQIWESAYPTFSRGLCEADEFLSGKKDDLRSGITLLARLPAALMPAVNTLRHDLERTFPEQYVVPEADLHVTILSIEPVRDGFAALPTLVSNIQDAVEEGLAQATAFPVEFSSLSASSSVAFICGFPLDGSINRVRQKIKNACFDRTVGLMVDSRYPLIGAHFSILRFVQPRISVSQLEHLKQLREIHLGQGQLTHLELVGNDWYMRAGKLKHYKTWELT
jgi:hypothetical protein